jgi:protein tyrosine phosphatase (PTP) superfamily phosphohydrolase (DUF442 family)
MNRSIFVAVVLSNLLSISSTQAAISPDTLEEIKAVEFNGDNIITAGLPSDAEFAKLQQAGVDLVINLIPAGNPCGHQDEASLVTNANMEYVNIGVDWNKPTREDVEQFFKVMELIKIKISLSIALQTIVLPPSIPKLPQDAHFRAPVG